MTPDQALNPQCSPQAMCPICTTTQHSISPGEKFRWPGLRTQGFVLPPYTGRSGTGTVLKGRCSSPSEARCRVRHVIGSAARTTDRVRSCGDRQCMQITEQHSIVIWGTQDPCPCRRAAPRWTDPRRWKEWPHSGRRRSAAFGSRMTDASDEMRPQRQAVRLSNEVMPQQRRC